MARPTYLWFIRHGEVEADYVGTFVGRLDVGLSDMGHHQAEAVAAYLEAAPFDAILSSPRTRARHTAAPLAKLSGLEPEVRQGFAEMDFGRWEGLHWPQIQALDETYAQRWGADPLNLPCPDGEIAGDFARRVQDELATVLHEFAGRNVALFAHAGVNRAILAALTRQSYMDSFVFAQDYGCLNAAAWSTDQPGAAQIALVNLVPGPRSESQGDGPRVA